MRHPIGTALALSLTLAFARPAHAQSTDPQTSLPHPPDHATILPLTTHVTYIYLQTSPDGTTTTQKEETLAINDAHARQSTANTVLSTGVTTTSVDDPIAGMRYVWNSSTKLAKALKYPEPVAGRRSCWKLPPDPDPPAPGDPQLNITGTTCEPAGYPLQQPPYCKSLILPTSSATDLPDVAVAPTSCASLLQQQPFQDLGLKTFAGFLAQGCRTTAPQGSQTNDIWAITLSSATLGAIVQVHGLIQSQDASHAKLQTTQDLTLLQVREPDPSTFLPPPDYQIKTVTMQEVPCDPLP